MITIQDTVAISRPAAEVWEFVSDCTNEPRWHVDCTAARLTTPQPLHVGSTQAWAMSYARGQEAQLRVTDLEPGRLLRLETIDAPMNIKPTLTYVVEPDGAATRFTRAMRVQPGGLARLMQPVLGPMMRRNNAGYLRKLKEVLELDQ